MLMILRLLFAGSAAAEDAARPEPTLHTINGDFLGLSR